MAKMRMILLEYNRNIYYNESMRLYSLVISISAIIIATLNAIFGSAAFGYNALYSVLATVIGALSIASIDMIVAFIVKALPKKLFSSDKKFFTMSRKERKLAEKLGIRRWKTKVPDIAVMGGGLSKSRLLISNDNTYISEVLYENAYAQVIHIAAAIVGFALVPLYPLEYWFCFGLPIAVVNCLLNCMSLSVLRYNFGRIKTLQKYNERRAKRKSEIAAKPQKTL
ncbi:MAG: hypothetical protein K2O04_03810 [Clostridiales bacterium]|nr:hypothetical protein [Clostridiales bacterium]